MDVLRSIGARILTALLTILGAVTLVFVLIRLVPGDPAVILMGEYAGRSTPEEIQIVREYLGTDRSIVEQYVRFVGRVATGDLGVSFRNRTPVLDEIVANLPPSLALIASGLLLAVLIGIPLGVFAATRRGRLGDYLPMMVSMLAIASPTFWFALLLVYFLGYRAGLFPIFGSGQGAAALHYLALPAIVVGTRSAALVARMTRSAMLEVLGQDYVRTARAKGLGPRAVLYGHALKNAAVPIITIVALDMAYLLSGAVVVEIVFSRPGLGKLLVDALFARDYPVVQGAILTFAAAVVIVNTLTDLSYRLVDPRFGTRA
jgi:peptide/nickel transport system permease protein